MSSLTLVGLLAMTPLSLAGLLPGPAPAAHPQDASRMGRVRDLGAMRAAGRLGAGGGQAEMAELLRRFDGGQIRFDELRDGSQAIDPTLLAGIQEDQPPPKSWSLALADPRLLAGSPVLDLALSPDDLEVVAIPSDDDAVFVDLTFLLADRERFEFKRAGEELHTVDELGGIELETGDYVWMHDGLRENSVVPGEDPTVIGGLIVRFEDRDDGVPDVRLLEVWSSFAQNPIVWNGAQGAYSTVVSLGLRVVAGAPEARGLPAGIRVVLGARGAHARSSQGSVELSAVGGESQDVTFNCERHGSSVALLTTLAGEQTAHPADVLATTAGLALRTSSMDLPAFGLGEVDLTVERLAEDGFPLHATFEETASLTAQGCELSSSQLTFSAGASVTSVVKLRSRSPGTASVVASIGGRRTELQVQSTWPWLLLIVSLVGGAIGRLLRREGEGEGEQAPRDARRIALRAGTGAVVGLVVVILLLTGLVALDRVPAGAVGSSAGAFAVALLSALAGVPLLRKLGGTVGLG